MFFGRGTERKKKLLVKIDKTTCREVLPYRSLVLLIEFVRGLLNGYIGCNNR